MPGMYAGNAAVVVLLIGLFVERTVSGSAWAFLPLVIAAALAASTTYDATRDRNEKERR